MTGYGRGTCQIGQRRLVVELRSVNHRFLEVKTRLPWPATELEILITQRVRLLVDRGVVSVSVRDEGGGSAQEVHADLSLARSFAMAIERIGVDLGIKGPVPLEFIASQPGVLTMGEALSDPQEIWKGLDPGVDEALAALVDSRTREGEALAKDLCARIGNLEELEHEISELTRDSPEAYRRRLRERLERVLKPGELDPARLAQEVAVLADRVDVTEELTRMRTHLVEFRRLVSEKGATGRRLDFLTQELNREANTIGSKSQSAQVTAKVVDCKAELERLREQIQNVE
jgi:uncharacterized protein (TIGR00255 family)